MELLGFIFDTNNWPFALAGCLLAGLMLVELMSTFLGFQLSGFLDDLIPDFDVDIDVDGDVPVLTKFIGWIRVGNVPILVLFLSFLFLYAIFGYLMQDLYHRVTQYYMYWWIAMWPPMFATIPFLRISSGFLSKFVIKEETTAVSIASLEGGIAIITLGTAKVGHQVEAKVKDRYGHTHYIRVEPEQGEFIQGSKVFLMKYLRSNLFIVTEPPEELLDK